MCCIKKQRLSLQQRQLRGLQYPIRSPPKFGNGSKLIRVQHMLCYGDSCSGRNQAAGLAMGLPGKGGGRTEEHDRDAHLQWHLPQCPTSIDRQGWGNPISPHLPRLAE